MERRYSCHVPRDCHRAAQLVHNGYGFPIPHCFIAATADCCERSHACGKKNCFLHGIRIKKQPRTDAKDGSAQFVAVERFLEPVARVQVPAAACFGITGRVVVIPVEEIFHARLHRKSSIDRDNGSDIHGAVRRRKGQVAGRRLVSCILQDDASFVPVSGQSQDLAGQPHGGDWR